MIRNRVGFFLSIKIVSKILFKTKWPNELLKTKWENVRSKRTASHGTGESTSWHWQEVGGRGFG